MKILITNVVYGKDYADLFLDQHLTSILDDTNVVEHGERLEYLIYTDAETRVQIESHTNFRLLRKIIPVSFTEFMWPSHFNHYVARYSILVQMFRESARVAMGNNMYLSFMVADLVVAKHFFTKMFARLDAGYDGVLVMPMRAAHESMIEVLPKEPGALDAIKLFQASYKRMSPLFTISHWNCPTFTEIPFYMIWNTGRGFLLRSFSITPIVLRPNKKMLDVKSTIDEEPPACLENPFYATDWIDAPVICSEFMDCFWPSHTNFPPNVQVIKEFKKRLHPSQKEHLKKSLYYPSKELAQSTNGLERLESDYVVQQILNEPKAIADFNGMLG